ncbi:MAG TPA: hypothetical protein VI942_05585, partial [Thermoanaerobaculia bacterium]|nr:hypothetical protein [Thermoanaerobaculia bacterium]
MRADQVAAILRREYLTRVKSKGFWIATLVLPLALAALVVLPSVFLARTKATHRMVVVDGLGGVGARLADELVAAERAAVGELAAGIERDREPEMSRFVVKVEPAELDADAQGAGLDARVLAGEIDSWIRVDRASLDASRVDYRAESVSNFLTQRRLEKALT